MKKIFILIFFLLSSCGYQPLYKVENKKNFDIQKIKLEGNNKLSKKIYSKLPFNIKNNDSLNILIIDSEKNIVETSKNSKGQITSYRTILEVNVSLLNFNNEEILDKVFNKEFSYNIKEDKFKFKQYQNKIEKDLIDKISEEIIIFLSL